MSDENGPPEEVDERVNAALLMQMIMRQRDAQRQQTHLNYRTSPGPTAPLCAESDRSEPLARNIRPWERASGSGGPLEPSNFSRSTGVARMLAQQEAALGMASATLPFQSYGGYFGGSGTMLPDVSSLIVDQHLRRQDSQQGINSLILNSILRRPSAVNALPDDTPPVRGIDTTRQSPHFPQRQEPPYDPLLSSSLLLAEHQMQQRLSEQRYLSQLQQLIALGDFQSFGLAPELTGLSRPLPREARTPLSTALEGQLTFLTNTGPRSLIPDSSSLVQDSFAETIGRIQEIETTEGFRFDKEEMKELAKERKERRSKQQKEKKLKPKRPLSAYNIFFKEERARILKSLANTSDSDRQEQEIPIGKIEKEHIFSSVDEKTAAVSGHAGVDPGRKAPHDDERGGAFSGATSESSFGTTVESRMMRKKSPHRKISFESLARQIGHNWQNLSEERIAHYKKLSEQDLRRYKREMEVFNARQSEVLPDKELKK